MPAPHPLEFRRRAVDLAREGSRPIAQLAKELGVSESGLRKWVSQAEIDEGHRQGLSTADREELVRYTQKLWMTRCWLGRDVPS